MASYVVMESAAGRTDGAIFIRDGFSWLAFLVAPLWLLWHALWVEALLAFVLLSLFSALGGISGFAPAGVLLTLLLALYVGLEGQGLRMAALRRRGWRDWGVVEASRLDDAEARYAYGAEEPAPAIASPRMVPDAALARPGQTGMVLGLSHTPGRP